MTAALLGLIGGAGLCLLYLGWNPRPVPLDQAIARLQGAASAPRRVETDRALSWDERFGVAAMRRLRPMARAIHNARADLRITDRRAEEQAGRTLVYGLFGLLLGPWLGLVSWLSGSSPSPTLLGAVSLFGAVIGALSPWSSIQTEAKARRRDFLLALAAWCDLVSMSLAAGRGLDQSVTTAAQAGERFAFTELRAALNDGAIRGRTAWESLDRLGDELGIADLRELGGTPTLAGEDGAAIREAVATKANTLRERITSETERAAETSTAQMGMPILIVAMGFLVFIGYPAIAALGNAGF